MSAALPLTGKRILVTRARHQAARLAQALEEQGAEVLRLPTIEIIPPKSFAPLDAALAAIGSFDWLLVTSVNGAAALEDRLRLLSISPGRLLQVQIAAIGSATAAVLERIGLTVSATPKEYVAESLVALLKDQVRGKRLLLVRAAVARDVIPEQLRVCGADLQVVEAYQTVIPADSIEQARQLFKAGKPLPDAVTFTSGSTVNNFFALLQAAQIELPRELRAVSIGPVTTQTLRQHKWEPACEAVVYDIPGVVDACGKLLGALALPTEKT